MQVKESAPVHEWRRQIVGIDKQVPVLGGEWVPYINVDNAATTPALTRVRDQVVDFLQWYSSVHRGTGFKSRLSTWVYEESRRAVLAFVGAPDTHTAIFTKNTTESVNVLVHRLRLTPDDVVVSSRIEHHANMLPWREGPHVEYLPIDADGLLDTTTLPDILARHGKRVKLVAISGASNVTGYTPAIDEIARVVHEQSSAELMVDGAQLAPHRRVNMRSADDPAHIDYLVMSAHKMYAPFGAGALIGPRSRFDTGEPYLRGGGAVKFVTLEDVEWDHPPEREEAGSPNVVGALAMATAANTLMAMGMDQLEEHERRLDGYVVEKLTQVPGLRTLGDPRKMGEDRIGVVSFVIDGVPSMKVAAVLGREWGIGVRAGCFCAHPYMTELLDVSSEEADQIRRELRHDDWSHIPSGVRVSLGLYNTEEEVDRLATALHCVANGECKGNYVLNVHTSEYDLPSEEDDFTRVFRVA